MQAVGWFEDGRVVRNEKQRPLNLSQTTRHPVLQIQERVRALQPRLFTYSRGASFAALNR